MDKRIFSINIALLTAIALSLFLLPAPAWANANGVGEGTYAYSSNSEEEGDEQPLSPPDPDEEEKELEAIRAAINVDDAVYKDSTVVKQGKTYTYIHHIYPQQLEEGEVTFALYEEGKAEPIEQVTYYIDYN